MVAPLTSGRRAVLTFGVPVAVFFVGYGALALVNVMGLAAYTETATLTPHARLVTVKVPDGALRLQPSPDGLVHVTAKGHYTLQRPTLHTASTASGVTVDGSGCSPFGVIVCGQDVTVLVPAGFTVVASSSAGDVRASGLAGVLQLHSSAGDVKGTGLQSAQVSASSSAGDVSITFAAVPLVVDATSSAGDVTVRVPGTVAYHVKSAHTSAGDSHVGVRQDDTSTHIITATSSAGDVTIEPTG